MHINLDLVEAVHLLCAMLLEVPNIAQNAYDPKKKIINRTFRRQLDNLDRQAFSGPPEKNSEIIIVASKALSKGNWKRCRQLIFQLPIWSFFQNPKKVEQMVAQNIQVEALRTYLFTYANFYDSMSIDALVQMFELPKNTLHSVISKMMNSEEFHASWDQPSNAIVMHKVDPSRLQYMALQFSEKTAIMVENNERLLDTKTNGYGFKDPHKRFIPNYQKQPYIKKN